MERYWLYTGNDTELIHPGDRRHYQEGIMNQDHTPVLINLLATARYDRMPEVPIQFITVGKLFYHGPEDAQIQYVESQQDEETGEIMNSDISLTFSKDKITIQREGDFSNTMVFSNGKRFEGVYHTPYGEMDMAVYTREAACRIGSGDGSVHLKYQLSIQGNYTSTNELHLEYKTDGSRNACRGGIKQ